MGNHATHPAWPHARRAAPAGLSLLAVLVAYAAVTTPPRDAGEPGQAGSRPASDPVPEGDPSTEGRVVLITGSTSGLGREVARRLARSGDHVIVHGRDVDRGTALVEEIERETDGGARFYRADFASLDQIREFSEAILRDYDRLDVLVNNAGIWLESADGRLVSQDGHELHFQVNYLAGYLLTDMLLPLLRKSAPSRIVNVSSGAQRPIDFGDVMLQQGYDPGRGYAQSKLAQVMFTFALAEELEGTGITVNALHPATMMNTNYGIVPRSPAPERRGRGGGGGLAPRQRSRRRKRWLLRRNAPCASQRSGLRRSGTRSIDEAERGVHGEVKSTRGRSSSLSMR